MSTRKNIFGLNEVYKLQIEGSWTTKDEVWIQPTFTSVIDDRIGSVVGSASTIGISTGSIVIGQAVRSNAVSAGTTITGIGTTTITISNPTTNASTDRFLFDFGTFNDTATYNYGTGASLVGYFVAGFNGEGLPDDSTGEITAIRRLDYSSDTITNVSDNIGEGRAASGQTVSSPTSGYYAGGKISTVSAPKSSISKLDFSSDTVSPVSATLGPAPGRARGASLSNKNFGYFGGGQTVHSPEEYTSDIERIDFSNDTTSDTTANIASGEVTNLAATGNKNFGYFAGGQYTSPNQAYINKFDYSNDTTDTSTVSPGLSVARNSLAATGNDNFGYFAGGYNGSANVSTVDRIDYSSDTIVSSPVDIPTLPQTQSSGAATGNASSGYWAGGDIAGDPNNDDVFKFDFSSETFSTISNALPNSVPRLSAFSAVRNFISDPNPLAPVPVPTIVRTFAYWTSGSRFSNGENLYKFNYSNNTSMRQIASAPEPLFRAEGAAATGNALFAYIAGGLNRDGDYISSIGRINYSNDTAFLTPSLTLSERTAYSGAMGNINFGYWTGGKDDEDFTEDSLTRIDRIDFSNDTNDATVVADMNEDRAEHGVVSNQSFGYIGGGSVDNTTKTSSIERYDFSNDTTDPSTISSELSDNKLNTATVGNGSYGYFCGGNETGFPYTVFSNVQRLDYSSGTGNIDTTGKLAEASHKAAGTSNSSYGWIAGGQSSSSASSTESFVQRIDFANDTLEFERNILSELGNKKLGTAFNAAANGAT